MIRILSLIVLGLTIMSCNTQPANTIRINGHIPADIAEVIYLKQGDMKDSIPVSGGNFDQNFAIQQPGFYTLEIGNSRFEVFLTPKSNLIIHADSLSNPLSVHFSGELGRENEHLLRLSEAANQINYRELFMSQTDDFKHFMDSILSEKSESIQKLNQEDKLNADFLRLMEIKNLASFGDKLLKYPMYHAYYNKSDEPALPENYYQFTQSIDINNEEYFKLREVKQFVSGLLSYYSDQMLKENGQDPEQADILIQSELQTINKYIQNQKIKNNLLYESLSNHMGYYGPANLDPTIQYFFEFCTDSSLQAKMTQEYKDWDYLRPGKPAPEWEAITLNGEKVNSTAFLGKYLYIDIWATWCGPCRREIPYLETLAEEFKNKNLTIVSVSVDKDKEAWAKMVGEGMKGNQLFAEGAFQSELALRYRVNAIPRFLLIDPNGMIINVSTDRPSGKIADLLNSLPGI